MNQTSKTLTPLAAVRYAIKNGLPAGVTFDEGSHAFWKELSCVTAEPYGRGFQWVLLLESGDYANFRYNQLPAAIEALAMS